MGRCCRHDSGEVRRQFLGRRPLIESGVRTAPHRNLAVTKWLFCEPFHNVVAVSRFVSERLELALGISTTTDIHQTKGISVGGEISAARVVAIGDVWCEGENDRCAAG